MVVNSGGGGGGWVLQADTVFTSDMMSLSVPLPPGSSPFWFVGFGSRFRLTLASPDTSFCQSQPGQMPVRSEHADTYLQRRAGWLQQ